MTTRANAAAASAAPPENAPAIPESDEYGDFHKIVLQGIIASGFLDIKGVKTLFTAACDYLKIPEPERSARTSMEYVQKVVRGINEQIKPFDMAIRSATDELKGKKYFLFMSTIEKSTVKYQTVFSKVEIEMFQICLDRILRKNANFAYPLNDCINVIRECDSRLSVQQGQDFIMRMIKLMYFAEYYTSVTEFDVTLGVRGLREFEPLLVDMYSDVIQSCSLCKGILLHGFRCPSCKILIHKHCYLKYLKSSETCQQCKTSWKREKDMIRRTRTTDEIIEQEGPSVDLSAYKSMKWHSVATESDTNPMPRLEPQVPSSRRSRR